MDNFINAPNRQSIRLPGYNYSGAGDYFITICIQNRECLLGHVENDLMVLNEFGLLVDAIWQDLPNHYPGLELGAWVVMPNHIHGVLILTGVGAIHESPAKENANQKFPGNEKKIAETSDSGRAIHGNVDSERTIHESPLHVDKRGERRKMILSKIIGRFKMTTGKQINLLRKTREQQCGSAITMNTLFAMMNLL